MLICIFSGLIVPKGLNCYVHLIKLIIGNSTSYIQEHEPLVLAKSPYAMIVIGLIVCEMFLPNIKYRLKDIFMLAGLTVLTFITSRQISMLVLIGGISVEIITIDILNKYSVNWEEKLKKEISKKNTCIVVIFIILIYSLMFYFVKAKDNYVDEKVFPIEATNWLKQNVDTKNIKLYNDYDFGSYLLFEHIPVFIDSRADLYTPEFSKKREDIFTDFFETTNMKMDYSKTFEKYGVTHIMLYNNRLLTMYLEKDSNYKIIYEDEIVTIFERVLK